MVAYVKFVCNFLLKGSNVYIKSGERVSMATKKVKQVQHAYYLDTGSHGRKVDFLSMLGILNSPTSSSSWAVAVLPISGSSSQKPFG